MTGREYKDLFEAILDLRAATEHGFTNVDRRFIEAEERWGRRFNALETRMEDGFREIEVRFDRVDDRFDRMEDRFCQMDSRFGRLEERIAALEFRIST